MKLPVFFLLLGLIPFANTSFANLILLQDDFDDNSIDPAKWNVVTNGIPQTPTGAIEQNGRLELQGRAHLNTAQEFDPNDPSVGGLQISGTWEYVSNDDFLQVLTRSDGSPSGGFGETQVGIEFRAFSIGADELFMVGRGASVTSSGAMPMPNGIAAGDVFDFLITDDGFNLSFQMTRTSNSADTVTVTGTSAFAPATNLIAFHNREAGRRSNLDNVLIQSLTIPEPSSLLLFAMGALLLRMGVRNSYVKIDG